MAIKQLPSEGWPGGERPNMGAPLPESLVPGGESDSAGFSWEGRNFDHHGTAFADDDGTTPEPYLLAVRRLRATAQKLQTVTDPQLYINVLEELAKAHAETIVASANSRMLVPLIAQAGDYGLTPEGKVVEKSQELSIVTVSGPDGRKVIPVFSSVAAMQTWNALARPIPVPGVQVAIAAAEEKTDLVIIDPGTSETEFGVRRTELESFALAQHRVPAWANKDVINEFEKICLQDPAIKAVSLAPGDAEARLLGPETVAGIVLMQGLNQEQVQQVVVSLQQRIGSNELLASEIDSLSIKLTS